MRPRAALIVLGTVTAAALAGVAASGFGGGAGPGAAGGAPDGPPATVRVRTTTLTQTEEVTGALGYGDAITLQIPATDTGTGTGTGTLTWLPSPGATVRRGEPLYAVNAQPVPLLYGGQPLYRTLQPGVAGDDVRLLERNLAELGYTGFTADDAYTSATGEAVADWQQDLGRLATGTVAPTDAAVADGAARVAQAHTAPGAAATGPVLDITGTERRIEVSLDAELEYLAEPDAPAIVELPDGTELDAVIARIGAATAQQDGSGPGAGPGTDPAGAPEAAVTIPLTLSVEDQAALGGYQAAPVTVRLAAGEREDVLAVPVNALVALREGGYGLEVVHGSATAYVAVETGMFAEGMVEVSGDGIEDGTIVGVPG